MTEMEQPLHEAVQELLATDWEEIPGKIVARAVPECTAADEVFVVAMPCTSCRAILVGSVLAAVGAAGEDAAIAIPVARTEDDDGALWEPHPMAVIADAAGTTSERLLGDFELSETMVEALDDAHDEAK